jgi:sugar-specific transcriptional regulator TrmB
MTHDPHSQPHAAAIAQLEWFNLSTYAARTLVALSGLGTGTAKDISEVSDVPRTRVYDAVDELHKRGLVDVQQSSPQQFVTISSETLRRKFDSETQHRLSVLTTALSNLEPVDRRVEQRGIWTVGEQDAIADRLLEFFAEADEEIVYLAADEYFSPELIDGLSAADDRGVSITLGGLSAALLAEISAEVSAVGRIDAAARPPAINRLLVVDGCRTLVGVKIGNSESDSETAIWGAGKTNSLVVIFKSMFGLNGETIGDE